MRRSNSNGEQQKQGLPAEAAAAEAAEAEIVRDHRDRRLRYPVELPRKK